MKPEDTHPNYNLKAAGVRTRRTSGGGISMRGSNCVKMHQCSQGQDECTQSGPVFLHVNFSHSRMSSCLDYYTNAQLGGWALRGCWVLVPVGFLPFILLKKKKNVLFPCPSQSVVEVLGVTHVHRHICKCISIAAVQF